MTKLLSIARGTHPTAQVSLSQPYWKKCFINHYCLINQHQNNIGTIEKYIRTSIKHAASGIILMLVYEIFPQEKASKMCQCATFAPVRNTKHLNLLQLSRKAPQLHFQVGMSPYCFRWYRLLIPSSKAALVCHLQF